MFSDLSINRLAILGIGNEQKGDDGTGIVFVRLLVKELQKKMVNVNPSYQQLVFDSPSLSVMVIEAGLAPENFSGPLRRFQPSHIVFVDSAEMGLPAGSIRPLDRQNISGFGGSTHLLPLSLLADFLVHELKSEISIIGIQPVNSSFEGKLSIPVKKSINKLVRYFLSIILPSGK